MPENQSPEFLYDKHSHTAKEPVKFEAIPVESTIAKCGVVPHDYDQEYIDWCRERLQRIVDISGFYQDPRPPFTPVCISEMVLNMLDEMDADIIRRFYIYTGANEHEYNEMIKRQEKYNAFLRRWNGINWPKKLTPEIPAELSDGKGGWSWPEPGPEYYKNRKIYEERQAMNENQTAVPAQPQ